MTTKRDLTVDTLVSRLEAQIAFHHEREAFHGAQESFHREQRGAHAAELEALTSKPSPVLMVKRVVDARPAGSTFGPSTITAEVNRRYQDRLRRPVKEKVISITLRRLLDTGALRLVREGRPHHEALYARVAE